MLPLVIHGGTKLSPGNCTDHHPFCNLTVREKCSFLLCLRENQYFQAGRFFVRGPLRTHLNPHYADRTHDIPSHIPREVVHTLLQADDVRIKRIIAHGHATAADFWYDQPQHEWGIVLQGQRECSSRMAWWR